MPELDTRWPFTRQQAIAAGITPMMLRGPGYTTLFRGVYLASDRTVTPEIRIRAGLLIHPEQRAWASHQSAATLYVLPVPHTDQVHVSVCCDADRRRREGISSHLATPQPLAWVRGVPLSEATQLFIDLAGDLGLVDLVVLGDAIVRKRKATVDELVTACAGWEGRHAREARRAVGYVRAKVDSAMESRLRMLIVLAGLPEPEVNFEIHTDMGVLLHKLDLSYPALKLAVEYDGQQHREDLAQWDSDIDRDYFFDRDGWRILPVISKGIYRRPDKTLLRVYTELKDRGCPDLPRRLSDEWRVHFPVRR